MAALILGYILGILYVYRAKTRYMHPPINVTIEPHYYRGQYDTMCG